MPMVGLKLPKQIAVTSYPIKLFFIFSTQSGPDYDARFFSITDLINLSH